MQNHDNPLHLLLDAAQFAADRHRDQRRKGADATPYINHPLDVAALLARHGVDDIEILTAAVLHDTVEDTETSIEEIEARFGVRVAGIVSEVTDDKSLEKAERKRLQVEHAPHKSREAKLVKIADKTSNLHDIVAAPPDWPVERKRDYFDWAERVVAGLRGQHEGLDAAFDAALAQRP
ncbi:HD domain-containing protein [Parasphingopyxis sp.]|uniref:HD domain-containing protein n=1 Tax=Parasphingopyxis sp. TaxID=1920299 RepID=UPI002629BC00|nr:HD domain-containing protein [Parasphingopyxis sp.]